MKDLGGKKNLNEPAMGAKSIKPQTMKNTLGRGGGYFTPGVMPAGGFQSMWCFGDNKGDYKNSPTTRPGKKVY
jgi:hypothetical protein